MDFSVFVESDNSSSEQRLSPHWTIATMRQKLWPITGIPGQYQRFNSQNPADDALVSELALQPLSVLKIQDARPKQQRENFTDDSQVEKFELTQEQYENRQDSVLAYKRRNKLGRFDPTTLVAEQEESQKEAARTEQLKACIGQRCKAVDKGHHGIIRYVGPVPEIPKAGSWVGIEYDEPVGKHTGTLQGNQYFSCSLNHGGFVRTTRIELGDFPVMADEELLASDDEM